ncbi:MAG: vWA domain-containing protein [Aridibacter sp.]
MKLKITISLILLTLFCSVSVFSQDEKPSAISILLDNTGSMYFEIDNIKKLGIGIVQNLSKKDEVKIFSFEKVKEEKAQTKINSSLDWTQDREEIYSAINELEIVGGKTTIFDGILVALKDLSQKGKAEKDTRLNKILILITDGEDRSSKSEEQDILD